MWRKAHVILVKDNLARLEYFNARRTQQSIGEIAARVEATVNSLPWFYRMPIRLIMMLIIIVKSLSFRPKQDKLPGIVKIIPFYGMVNKLVRNLSLLFLFDVCPADIDGAEVC